MGMLAEHTDLHVYSRSSTIGVDIKEIEDGVFRLIPRNSNVKIVAFSLFNGDPTSMPLEEGFGNEAVKCLSLGNVTLTPKECFAPSKEALREALESVTTHYIETE